jgi:oxalate decarboxylase/phosphoglucose isomerase-like protein (cupin superfamily)
VPRKPRVLATSTTLARGHPIREVYVVELGPSELRAGHWHARKHEWLCVLSGHVTCELEARAGQRTARRRVSLGALAPALYIPPRTGHTLRNRGGRPAVVLVMSSVRYDPAAPDHHPLPAPGPRPRRPARR